MQEKPKYDHQSIEKKWQKYWKDHHTFRAKLNPEQPKYYVLDMFPYPSGAGLHVGHVTGYTGTDIVARYKRQKGFNVLHPIGWDSFGLPAEQYAIRTGTHPAITTEKNIHTYRRQLSSLGFSYDWTREITTSDPLYYKWTQWIFTKLYEKGLAYEAEINVNFCPTLGTVLANEEVENGKSKEGGYPVERRPLRQWVLKITAYAERLLDDLDTLDWPDHLKKLQRSWIGKSEGLEMYFLEENSKEKIHVFTTRQDTLFGVSYLVLAPEHPLIEKIVSPKQEKQVEEYKKKIASKSDLERTELAKEKSGVWTGAYATHPITKEKLPIWVADYVLMDYGSGAVMGVPAHDQRDFEFATQFELPIRSVFDPDMTQVSDLEGLSEREFKQQVLDGKRFWDSSFGGKMIHSSADDISIDGLTPEEAKDKIASWLEKKNIGKRSIHYKLRDWLFSRQRYWGEPFPILHFDDGSMRTLELDELPLVAPPLEDYKPAGTGESPLAKAKDWVEITDPKTGKKALRETNTMPQWAGSCWYYLRFLDPHNEDEAWSKEAEKYWMPIDLYVGGSEHAVLHLLYARFWHKVLYDCGLVHTIEPFQVYRNQGLVTAHSYKKKGGGYVTPEEVVEKNGKYFDENGDVLERQVEKMSKSKLNGITPDEIIEEYGADALRLYEMFMGPFDKEKLWNPDAVTGCRRFLNRFYDLAVSEKVTEEDTKEGLKCSYLLVHQVTKDIEEMQFNTAIAHMMEFVNRFSSLDKYPKKAIKMATQMLYPFAPHIAEEIWEILGEQDTITYAPIAEVDESYLQEETAIYVLQVNGKMRGKWELPKGKTEEEFFNFVKTQPQASKYLTDEIVKKIYIPNKLLNVVVKS